MPGTVPLLDIDPPKHPESLTDLVSLLERLIGAFGTRRLDLLLDVKPSGTSAECLADGSPSHRRFAPDRDVSKLMTSALRPRRAELRSERKSKRFPGVFSPP
jgi:hypothetical protein